MNNQVEFYKNIVKSLKDDANLLNKRLTNSIENHDSRESIDNIRLLKDTLLLIKEYDGTKPQQNTIVTSGNINCKIDCDGSFTETAKKIVANNLSNSIENIESDNEKIDTTNYGFNHWYNLFSKAIEKGESLLIKLPYGDKDLEKLHRCSGKSFALVKIAEKFQNECAFLIDDKYKMLSYNGMKSPYYKLDTIYSINKIYFNSINLIGLGVCKLNLSQYATKRILLIDDNMYFTQEELDKLKEKYIVIGFTR